MDWSDTNDVRTLAVLSVPAGARVLDLGGGGGLPVAEALSARGCTVSLVAADECTAREVGRHCAGAIVADLDSPDLGRDLGQAFGEDPFDAVLAMGTLQHVRAPVTLLRLVATRLTPSGRIVATLPNVAHGAVRLELLRGRFRAPGADGGDREPLHLFDAVSTHDLLEEAGLAVVEQLKVTRELHETEAKLDPSTFGDQVLSEIAADPDALVYELVVVAAPVGSAQARSLPAEATLAERLQARTEELAAAAAEGRSRIASLEELVAALNQRVEELTRQAAQVATLEAALRSRESELAALQEDRRHLQLDVTIKDEYITELRLRVGETEAELARARKDLDLTRWNADAALTQTRTALDEAQASLQAETQESARLRARAAELDLLHHRLAARANRVLHRVPLVRRAIAGAAGLVARRRPRG